MECSCYDHSLHSSPRVIGVVENVVASHAADVDQLKPVVLRRSTIPTIPIRWTGVPPTPRPYWGDGWPRPKLLTQASSTLQESTAQCALSVTRSVGRSESSTNGSSDLLSAADFYEDEDGDYVNCGSVSTASSLGGQEIDARAEWYKGPLPKVSRASAGNLHDLYLVGEDILGEGNFGTVRRATMKATGAQRAVKSISQSFANSKAGLERQEVLIMKIVEHPNLVMLYEMFEDADHLHLVVELCAGGHLLNWMKGTSLTEPESATVMQQILRAINYLHRHSISHRDVKAENCLVTSRHALDWGMIKVGDFGLSKIFRPKEVWKARVGTPTHWAPEVLARSYTRKCDLWACGVVMYQSLCGNLPFTDENDCKEIREGSEPRYDLPAFENKEGAVALIRSLLTRDYHQRPNAVKALKNTWLEEWAPLLEEAPFKRSQFASLRRFRSLNLLHRIALYALSAVLSDKDIKPSRKLFVSLDRNGNGEVTESELARRLSKRKSVKEQQIAVDQIFQDSATSADVAQATTGERPFKFSEFMAATLSPENLTNPDSHAAAFRMLDKNGDQMICASDLASCNWATMVHQLSVDDLTTLLRKVDPETCSLTLEAFCRLLESIRPPETHVHRKWLKL